MKCNFLYLAEGAQGSDSHCGPVALSLGLATMPGRVISLDGAYIVLPDGASYVVWCQSQRLVPGPAVPLDSSQALVDAIRRLLTAGRDLSSAISTYATLPGG